MIENLKSIAPLGKSDHVGLVWTFITYLSKYLLLVFHKMCTYYRYISIQEYMVEKDMITGKRIWQQ